MALKDYFFSFEPSQSLVCLICGLHPSQQLIKVMLRWSVNLTTLSLGRLHKRLTSTKCTSFRK